MPGAGEAGSEARGLPEPHALVREAVEARAAVRRAMEAGEELRRPIEERDEEARDVHFGGKRRTEGGQPDQRLRTAPGQTLWRGVPTGYLQPHAANAASDGLAGSRRGYVRYNRLRPTMLSLPAYPPTGRKALCLRW